MFIYVDYLCTIKLIIKINKKIRLFKNRIQRIKKFARIDKTLIIWALCGQVPTQHLKLKPSKIIDIFTNHVIYGARDCINLHNRIIIGVISIAICITFIYVYMNKDVLKNGAIIVWDSRNFKSLLISITKTHLEVSRIWTELIRSCNYLTELKRSCIYYFNRITLVLNKL